MYDYVDLKKIYNTRGTNYFTPKHLTIPFIKEHLKENPGRIISLGCGDGRILKEITILKPKEIVGVDMSSVRIDVANKVLPTAMFYCEEIEKFLESCDETFDVVFLFEVLEHLFDDLKVLNLIPKICPNGLLLGSVPVNIPDEAHSRLFKSQREIVARYNLSYHKLFEKHVYFKKEIKGGVYGSLL